MAAGVRPTRIFREGYALPDEVSIDAVYSGDDADWDEAPGVGGQDQWKQPVRCATTASVTIATALNAGDTIDGVTLAAGDRVLVKDQGTASQNGIYLAGGTPARAPDMDADEEVLGAVVYVIDGSQAGTLWTVTNDAATIVDTDAIDWAQVTGSGSGITVQEEGTPLATLATTLDFVGAGVTATGAGATKTITITGGSLPWFDVTAYGATGDGTTDDTTAVNLAIAALNTAGAGVLYFPAGTYKVVSALTTITAEGTVLGDGMGAYDGSAYASAITCTSQTAVLFTVTADQLSFRDIGLFNTYAGTASAGCAIKVNGSHIGQKVDLHSVVVAHFYDNVVRDVGSQWVNENVWNWGPVRYGESIQNTVNQDAGDWTITGCNYYANTNNATAAIYQTGAGGGKISGVKINGNGSPVKTFTDGIRVVIPTGVQTSVMTITGCSIENVSGDAISIAATGTGSFGLAAIADVEVGLYTNNTGRAVNLTAATNGTIGSAGSVAGIVIDGLVVRTDGTARAAISLTKTDRVTLGSIQLTDNFTSRYTSSADTNTTDGASVSFASPTIALGSSASTGAASTVIRSDATIAAFDATAPVTQAFGDAAATGSAAYAARRDHVHGMPATPSGGGVGPLLIEDTPAGSPLVFADLLQNEEGTDLLYADIV